MWNMNSNFIKIRLQKGFFSFTYFYTGVMDADAPLNQLTLTLTHRSVVSDVKRASSEANVELPLYVHFMHITYKCNMSPDCLLTYFPTLQPAKYRDRHEAQNLKAEIVVMGCLVCGYGAIVE
jgi:hypothetical protein